MPLCYFIYYLSILSFSRAQLQRMRAEREESEKVRKDLEEKVRIMEEEQKKRLMGKWKLLNLDLPILLNFISSYL